VDLREKEGGLEKIRRINWSFSQAWILAIK
jgi:hypothetical protein